MAEPDPSSIASRVSDAILAPAAELVRIAAATPASVARIIHGIAAEPRSKRETAILARLAGDARMIGVYRELLRRDRKTGRFLHPVRPHPDDPPRGADDAQHAALGELFSFVFQAASDRVRVAKPADIASIAAELSRRADLLRVLAADPENAAEAEALIRVAARLDAHIANGRSADDPLTIQNDRGDRVLRGCSIVIASFLRESFGTPLDALAGTIAATALGVAPQHSRASRAAFSGRKRREKTGC